MEQQQEQNREPIRIPDGAIPTVLKLKAKRPPLAEERLFWAGMAAALGVPQDWQFSDEQFAFLPPTGEQQDDRGGQARVRPVGPAR